MRSGFCGTRVSTPSRGPVCWHCFPAAQLVPYVIAQLVGAILAAAVLYVVATGKAGVDLGGFASLGFGEHSPGGYGMVSAFVLFVESAAR